MQSAKGHQFDAGDPKKLFEIIEKVGSGSYGDVFKARVVATGAIAALKIIILEPGENLDDIMIEVNMLRNSQHPNIVSYYGCYFRPSPTKGHDSVWIAMEYCGGGSVEAMYKAMGAFTEQEIACVMKDLLMGMAYLHEKKCIHRDVKGGNLLFTEQGQIKLADFGVSATLTKTLKKRQTVIGSPYWMAPEVITAEDSHTPYDERADVWSIGITAIEMAECAPPLYDLHPMRALFMIPKNKPPTLSKKSGKWSKDFQDFIAQTVVKNPKKRPDAKDLLKHPFILSAKNTTAVLSDTVDKFKHVKNMDNPPKDTEEGSDPEDNSAPVTPSPSANSINASVLSTVPPENLGPMTPVEGSSDTARVHQNLSETESQLLAMGFSATHIREAILLFGDDLEKTTNYILNQTSDEVTRDSDLARQLSETMKVSSGQVEGDERLARELSGDSRKRSTGSSSRSRQTQETFRAQKLCRIKKNISCGDFWEREMALLIGLEEGLVWIKADADSGKQKLASISNRAYSRIQVIEEIDSLVSISGKMGSVCISDLKTFDMTKKKSNFESDTKMKKIKDSKGSSYFQVVKLGRSIYLLIAKPGAILITKWAAHPFNRFMEVKEIPLEQEYVSMNLHEMPEGEPVLFLGIKKGFQIIELDGGTSIDVIIDDTLVPEKGTTVGSVTIEKGVLLCFSDFAFPVTVTGQPNGPPVKWRAPINTVLSMSDYSFVTLGQDNFVDIWSTQTLRHNHTFNNSNKIFPMRMSKANRVIFGCLEDKGEGPSVAVVSIVSDA